MRIILLQDVRGIGRKNEIKEVRDGYVRNFLLPKNLVKIATSEAVKQFTKEQEALKAKREVLRKKLLEKSKTIEDAVFSFYLKTGEKGEVFGSVTKKDIEKTLNEKGIPHAGIKMKNDHLKTTGDHRVEIVGLDELFPDPQDIPVPPAFLHFVIHDRKRFVDGPGVFIRAASGQGVIDVHDGDDPHQNRNLVFFQAVRIARAVQLFMVVADQGNRVFCGAEALADRASHHGMRLHDVELVFGERSGL